MPIFHVDLASDSPMPPPSLATNLARELGAFMRSEPGHVWVRITHCPPSHYAENAEPPYPRWAFVRTILRDLPPEGSERANVARGIAQCVARLTDRPLEDVHVIFEPCARGRIAFGGELVT